MSEQEPRQTSKRLQAAAEIRRIVETEITETTRWLPEGMEKKTVTKIKATDFVNYQETHRFAYTLIAALSGIALLVLLIVISIYVPEPSKFQLRLWLVVMALAAGGFATTITGLLNVNAKIGTQIAVGATGAFGVMVLFYLVNPAVL